MRRFVQFLTSFRPKPIPELSSLIRQAGVANQREAEKDRTIHMLSESVVAMQTADRLRDRNRLEDEAEYAEAARMVAGGPWQAPPPGTTEASLRESFIPPRGIGGDIDLALSTVGWRREGAYSWLEFSRWGINQIILICRLYRIKNPLIQRGINVSAQYVFGRGVEVSSPDEAADSVLKEFFARNKATMGQIALADLERQKYTDGNIFWVLFSDKEDKGEVNIRTIDALEISEIVCDPDDSSVPQYYRREWTQKNFDSNTGAVSMGQKTAWYPALNFEKPAGAPEMINGVPVLWNSPVLHRRCGAINKWHFGCPLAYAAIAYAQATRRFLEDCMTRSNSLAQFSMLLITKGGQQALEGAKQQLSTRVATGGVGSAFDPNPPAGTASIFASGPGTELKAFDTGSKQDMSLSREGKLMVAMVFGIPESFFSDMNTSNLATATSLDRPTELNFMEKQEAWREDLVTIAEYVLKVSYAAPSGKLREAMAKRSVQPGAVKIFEAKRVTNAKGQMVYEIYNSKPPVSGEVKVLVTFPTIIEADVPAMVTAAVASATMSGGSFTGMDEKETVRLLYRLNGIENAEEILELQYPSEGPDKYDPLRKPEPDVPLDPVTGKPVQPAKPAAKEALGQVTQMKNMVSRLGKAIRVWEAEQDETRAS